MEGKSHPMVVSVLRRWEWTYGDHIDNGEVIESLVSHPGWELLERITDEALAKEEQRIADSDRVFSHGIDGLIKSQAEIAHVQGVKKGIPFHRDAVATVLAKAKTARQLIDSGTPEASVERS